MKASHASISGRATPTRIAYGAHAVHDGFTDLIYVLLPTFQAEFGLSYAQTGLVKAIYSGSLALCQTPAVWLAGHAGARTVLAGGTAATALGFLLAGAGTSFAALIVALAVMGIGASVQHPIASDIVAEDNRDSGTRQALSRYNFAGDIGKVIFPLLVALLLGILSWRAVSVAMGIFGLAAAAAIAVALSRPVAAKKAKIADSGRPRTGPWHHPGAFAALLSIGIIDSATRMSFLTFLPFLLMAKGAAASTIGLALSLVFAGGACGKLVCGWLATRIGATRTVFLTETLTAIFIIALPFVDLVPALLALPLLGAALNGTSSALYGSVPELAGPAKQRHAFAIFYTGTIGAGAVSPVIYGAFSDQIGVAAMMFIVGTIVMLTLPLAYLLGRLSQPDDAG